MQNNLEQSGYPTGGSLRLSGTMLHTSPEFQSVLKRSGEHPVMVRGSSGAATRHPPTRGLWE